MARTFFGSKSVEDTRQMLEADLARQVSNDTSRQKANALLRGTGSEIQSRKRVAPPQTKKKKPQKIIKVDPNVKPIAPTLGPVGMVTSLVDAFKGAKKKAKQVASAGTAKFKEVTAASAAKPGEKTVVPLTAKPSRNPFVKNTSDNVKVVPLKGFEKLAKEQGVPQKQTLKQAQGIRPGQSGPLPNALRKRKAAQNRKAGLGGDRATAGRTRSRVRPNLVANAPTPDQRERLAKIPSAAEKKSKESRSLKRRLIVSGVIGGAIGAVGARRGFR
jgi:hypothetical protein